jgi:predicted dehydrogenase
VSVLDAAGKISNFGQSREIAGPVGESSFPGERPPEEDPAMGGKTIRYGIIGFGAFAERSIAPALLAAPNSELTAIQKRSLDEARSKARTHNVRLAFSDARTLAEHPDVDAVFVASANASHARETMIAAAAGKHVLVEKPMAVNRHEAEQMIASCASAGVRLMVAHKVRFSPLIGRMRSLIAQGAIGRVTAARADFVFSATHSPRTWIRDRKLAGGGPVFDIGVHCLDTLRFVLDDEVVSVSAELSPQPTESLTEDSAQIALTFSRGAIGSIFCSFVAPIRRSFIRIMGTSGILSALDFTTDARTLRLVHSSGKEGTLASEHVDDIEVPNLVVEEITHFSECILSGKDVLSPGESGLRNQIVLDAVMECQGRPLG